MEEESAGGCAGVDRIRQASELDSIRLQLADEIDELLDAPAQPVKFPNHKCVSRAKVLPSLSETEAFSPTPARPVFEDLLAAGLSKRLRLQFQVLILG